MSIRLRLTLLYTTILTLTLVVFGVTLYAIQSQSTFDTIKNTLARQMDGFANIARRPPPFNEPQQAQSTTQPSNLPGRWTQIRNASGAIIARSPDLADTPLPLSDAGSRAVRSNTPWVETAQVDDLVLLIYSQSIAWNDGSTRIVQIASPIAEREQSLNSLRWTLIAATSIATVIAFAIGWILAGAALEPIHRITNTAQAIGAERDFSRRVEHTGPNDEIGELATTFNAMVTQLESAFRQVEQALQAQRRFVADASHELRTPLTTIRGNIELLRRNPPMDERESAEILADAKDEVERLIRLVQQLLTLARADTGRILRRDPIALRPFLDDVYRQGKQLAPARTIQCEAVDTSILGDRDALKQVLLILLDNALVHTPSSATIGIAGKIDDQQVTISIRDSGLGISPEILPRIFERFVRGDVSRSGGGTGLGLSIAKELVEAQEGTLSVTSQPGQGSLFTVTLPRAKN